MFTDDQGSQRETPDELTIEHKLDLILVEMRHMRGAFPKDADGEVDYDGHRKYHESLIRAAEAQEAFWTDLKQEIIKKGILGALVIALGLLLLGAQTKLGLPLK
ncbi:hypothetical protein [Flavobacterium sp.]|jgi:hypothetical protein|uniref:hypothetical protein n=1 Tax=Flavobacterium sp. TaxID=239 RepID=UPI0037BF2D79